MRPIPPTPERRPARRIDSRWDGAPTIDLQNDDGTWLTYQLNPAETAALVKQLANHLHRFHRPTHDRTAESVDANPHSPAIQQLAQEEPAS